jgi:hypothetical protein
MWSSKHLCQGRAPLTGGGSFQAPAASLRLGALVSLGCLNIQHDLLVCGLRPVLPRRAA